MSRLMPAKVWGLHQSLPFFAVGGGGPLGFVIGSLAIRRQGIYFAMVRWPGTDGLFHRIQAELLPAAKTHPGRQRASVTCRPLLFVRQSSALISCLAVHLGGILIC